MAPHLRVLVIPSWYPSAKSPTAGIFIYQQVQALAAVGFDVAVLYIDAKNDVLEPRFAVEDGVPTVRCGVSAGGRFSRLSAYPRTGAVAYDILRSQWGEPDIIHVQALFPAAMIARTFKRRHGIPYVVTEHSEEYLAQSERRLAKYPIVVRSILRPLALGASRTIAVSGFLADRLSQLGLAVEPTVIPNVVPVSEPEPFPVSAPHRIAHVSVMGPAKNIEGLLAAIDSLRRRRGDFVLTMVGDGELRGHLESVSRDLDLEGFVEFVGRKPVDEVREILASASFTVVSSTHETFSVSAAESLMCGRPVLSTRCGGPESFIIPQVGRLIEVGSVPVLVEGLDWMLDHFSEFSPQDLHEYAMQRFAPDVVARKILDVYEEVLDV